MKALLSEKGQVTIPKALRESLGLFAGTVIEFEAENGRLVGRKRLVEDPLVKWRGRGHLPHGLGVDAYLRRARGE